MPNLCTPATRHSFVPAGTGAGLRLSSVQIDFLRQMGREFRTGFMVAPFQRKRESSQGTLALYSGSSGTGKTMAAEVIARELRTSLVRANLNHVVSKYIGETEKNLARVFEAAQKKAAVLLFDEADALFGKRSEVKDSHDRYANLEVSHLLNKLEAYRGLVILSSNQKVDIDPTVMCRVKYQLEFSPPIPAPRRPFRR